MRIHILTNQEFTDVYKYSTEVTIHFGDDNAFLFLSTKATTMRCPRILRSGSFIPSMAECSTNSEAFCRAGTGSGSCPFFVSLMG